MLNKAKVLEFFDASKLKAPIHIIGCGAIGSHVLECLVRMGCSNIHLWDFDKVSAHNITNQLFYQHQIGMPKVAALDEIAHLIDPDVKIVLHDMPWKDNIITGYIFMCVDSIGVRKDIYTKLKGSSYVKAFFDFRMRLTDAQHYAAKRTDLDAMKKMWDSMDFTSEEAKEATPKSACNVELSVAYTVKTIVALGIGNFTNMILGKPYHTMMLMNHTLGALDSFEAKGV